MSKYVDGFLVPVPKNKVAAYVKLAKLSAKVWKDHGAIDYFETQADDVSWGKRTSFPRSVKMKKNETVFFSWVTYKSKKHRDSVMKKVMKDPRLEPLMDIKTVPFDAKRMIFGGFKTVVQVRGR